MIFPGKSSLTPSPKSSDLDARDVKDRDVKSVCDPSPKEISSASLSSVRTITRAFLSLGWKTF